jgi:hypothetical protein
MDLDTFLEIIKKSELSEIKKLCESNKLFNMYCKENKDYIYRHLIRRDFPGRESESPEDKYKRLLGYKKGQPSYIDKWYAGVDLLEKIETYRNPEIFNKIIKINPDVNKSRASSQLQESTPLMMAIQYGTPEQVNKLLDLGANVNAKNNIGWTPLMTLLYKTEQPFQSAILYPWSLYSTVVDIINRLLDLGTDVNIQSSNGLTALMIALENSTPEVINRLLDLGADVNIIDNSNVTPLILAQRYSTREIVNRIKSMIQGEQGQNEIGFDIKGIIKNGNLQLIFDSDSLSRGMRKKKCETLSKEELAGIANELGNLYVWDTTRQTKKKICDSIQKVLRDTGRMIE